VVGETERVLSNFVPGYSNLPVRVHPLQAAINHEKYRLDQ
jgi:hypothetical protein